MRDRERSWLIRGLPKRPRSWQCDPDLVIASVPYQEKAVVEILKAGARFLGLAPKTLADIYTDIAHNCRCSWRDQPG